MVLPQWGSMYASYSVPDFARWFCKVEHVLKCCVRKCYAKYWKLLTTPAQSMPVCKGHINKTGMQLQLFGKISFVTWLLTNTPTLPTHLSCLQIAIKEKMHVNIKRQIWSHQKQIWKLTVLPKPSVASRECGFGFVKNTVIGKCDAFH